MGRDKAWLPFDHERMLARVARLVGETAGDVVVIGSPDQELPALPETVRVLRDDVPDQGPLGGLIPGLRHATADALFATSCDAPFISADVIDLLFGALGDADVAVAEAEGYLHPLCAVYRPRVRPVLEALLAAGRRRPVFLYDEVPTVRVGEARLRAVDPELSCLRNLNDEAAYTAALADTFPEIRIELYDLARARAGTAEVTVRGATLGGALLALADGHAGLVPDVISAEGELQAHWRVSLGGETFIVDPRTPLDGATPLLLLSALAGG